MPPFFPAPPPPQGDPRFVMPLQRGAQGGGGPWEGETAVTMLEAGHYDTAVIDDDLPDMFGTELILLLRNVPGHATLPAVVLLPSCAADAEPAESETPTPEVPSVYRVFKPASCGDIQAAVEGAVS